MLAESEYNASSVKGLTAPANYLSDLTKQNVNLQRLLAF